MEASPSVELGRRGWRRVLPSSKWPSNSLELIFGGGQHQGWGGGGSGGEDVIAHAARVVLCTHNNTATTKGALQPQATRLSSCSSFKPTDGHHPICLKIFKILFHHQPCEEVNVVLRVMRKLLTPQHSIPTRPDAPNITERNETEQVHLTKYFILFSLRKQNKPKSYLLWQVPDYFSFPLGSFHG